MKFQATTLCSTVAQATKMWASGDRAKVDAIAERSYLRSYFDEELSQ